MYYSLTKIDKLKAIYNMIIGERSNGKTYAVCEKLLKKHITDGAKGAYLRRYEEEIMPKNIKTLFEPHDIAKITHGEFNSTIYKQRGFYLTYVNDSGEVERQEKEPFCIALSLNTSLTTKGADRGKVDYIIFDEFMTRDLYLTNEFILFTNLISSLIRDRDGAIIYMLANTVNKYCPYFKEMRIGNIEELKQGEIKLFTYENSGLTVAIEWCAVSGHSKKVGKYFAFDNPRLQMITGGKWELPNYPRSPIRVENEKILLKFYIKFDGSIICGNIIKDNAYLFILFHPHTGRHEPNNNDIIYMQYPDGAIMHVKYIDDTPTEAHQLIKDLIYKEKCFYSDNETGEKVRNWKINIDRGALLD